MTLLAGMTVTARQATTAEISPVLELQVLLNRAGFSCGEIDARAGSSTDRAVAAFRSARRLPPGTGPAADLLSALGSGTIDVIVPYTIAGRDVAGPLTTRIPADLVEQSKLDALGYTSVLEGEPSHVGRTTSHGCVRLTNWDATHVASLVRKGTPVVFER